MELQKQEMESKLSSGENDIMSSHCKEGCSGLNGPCCRKSKNCLSSFCDLV